MMSLPETILTDKFQEMWQSVSISTTYFENNTFQAKPHPQAPANAWIINLIPKD